MLGLGLPLPLERPDLLRGGEHHGHPLILRSAVARTKHGSFPRPGLCCSWTASGTLNPSASRSGPPRFRCLIRSGWWSPHPAERVSSTGQWVFLHLPSLLPRESTRATSVVLARIQRPSPCDHRVGVSSSFPRLLIGSLALRPALLRFGHSRPPITPAPLPHATKAYGQLLGRDFNPLDSLLLLRTVWSLLWH